MHEPFPLRDQLKAEVAELKDKVETLESRYIASHIRPRSCGRIGKEGLEGFTRDKVRTSVMSLEGLVALTLSTSSWSSFSKLICTDNTTNNEDSMASLASFPGSFVPYCMRQKEPGNEAMHRYTRYGMVALMTHVRILHRPFFPIFPKAAGQDGRLG